MQMSKKNESKTGQKLLMPPNGAHSVLLHSCCAPCSGGIMEALQESGLEVTLFFYNPNIHPRSEYLLRKEENKLFADKLGISCVDGDYLPGQWLEDVKGLELEPERGQRCSVCFTLRLEETARYASEQGIPVFATTLGISRWKDLAQVDCCGRQAATKYPGVSYWDCNWRKGGGSQRMIEISRREGFYHQEYCGCRYSLQETNRWREERGRPLVERELGE
jgi:predicted adenine nucleotide alpha hydrolase (AANH) superfamily ATPase